MRNWRTKNENRVRLFETRGKRGAQSPDASRLSWGFG
jgi:hypothetical protein